MGSAEAWNSEPVDRNFHSRWKDFLGVQAAATAPRHISNIFPAQEGLTILPTQHQKPPVRRNSDPAARVNGLRRLTESKLPRLGFDAPCSILQSVPLDQTPKARLIPFDTQPASRPLSIQLTIIFSQDTPRCSFSVTTLLCIETGVLQDCAQMYYEASRPRCD